jgi:glycosyltransferase involved in cell wall biosynthesis
VNPLVSAVVPAYNAMGHIGDCLASVFDQRSPFALEVIAVNDGSTDGTLEKLRGTPGLTCLTQDNRGPAAARNSGIRHARGEFIAFLDADDLWPQDKLCKQVELLQAHPDAALCFGDCRQFEDGRARPQTLFEEGGHGERTWGKAPYVSDPYIHLLQSNFITTGSVVVRRRVLEEVGGFDESLRLVEDLELWLRIARRHPVIWCRDVCLLRRRHAGNTSREAEAMSLAYLQVLKRQQTCCAAELAHHAVDVNAIVAREYREMAERALAGQGPKDALRWAWQSFVTRPSLRALWNLARGAGQKLGRVR